MSLLASGRTQGRLVDLSGHGREQSQGKIVFNRGRYAELSFAEISLLREYNEVCGSGTPMTIQQEIVAKLRGLPAEKQKEVLQFVDSLRNENGSQKPRRSLLGLWAELDVEVTDEDIVQARKELWGEFPRDIQR
jgi:hypothetical protein